MSESQHLRGSKGCLTHGQPHLEFQAVVLHEALRSSLATLKCKAQSIPVLTCFFQRKQAEPIPKDVRAPL